MCKFTAKSATLQIDRTYSCTWKDCMGQNETLHTLIFHTGGVYTHSLTQPTRVKIVGLQISCVCETLTKVGEKCIFQTPGGVLTMSSCQDSPQVVRGEGWGAPLPLCGCWAIFVSYLFVQIAEIQTETPPLLQAWDGSNRRREREEVTKIRLTFLGS